MESHYITVWNSFLFRKVVMKHLSQNSFNLHTLSPILQRHQRSCFLIVQIKEVLRVVKFEIKLTRKLRLFLKEFLLTYIFVRKSLYRHKEVCQSQFQFCTNCKFFTIFSIIYAQSEYAHWAHNRGLYQEGYLCQQIGGLYSCWILMLVYRHQTNRTQ